VAEVEKYIGPAAAILVDDAIAKSGILPTESLDAFQITKLLALLRREVPAFLDATAISAAIERKLR